MDKNGKNCMHWNVPSERLYVFWTAGVTTVVVLFWISLSTRTACLLAAG